MDNLIIDHFSVTKRHNIQQTIEVTSSNGQQVSLVEQTGSEQLPGHGPGSQRSQFTSVTEQGQDTSEQTDIRAQLTPTSAASAEQSSSTGFRSQPTSAPVGSIEQSLDRCERGPRADRRSTSSEVSEAQRSPPIEHSEPSSSCRERTSRSELSAAPVGLSEMHRSPNSGGSSSTYISRAEQSDTRSRCADKKRVFSFEHVTDSPGLRRSQRISISAEQQRTAQSEHGPPNFPHRPEHQRVTKQPEGLPPNSHFRSGHHLVAHESEHVQHNSPQTCEHNSSQIDNDLNMSSEKRAQQEPARSPQAAVCLQLTKHNIDVSVTTFCKPKLIRLRSEPCTFNTTMTDTASRGHYPSRPGGRRRREELKRSLSFEVASPSCYEALWTGINVPSQLIITRPQLLRARLNRKHLSLHLEGVSGDLNSLRNDSPLQFHDTHGDNIQLLNNKTRARRYESFCKGICFSNRPIAVNEKVYVKFVETNTSWSGVLRFGFTSIDPGKIRGGDLPRYACPDLTNKPGNWAKALGERYATSNILLHFSVNSAGDVTYGVNGEDKGIFFSGVVTSQSLWAMLDIYGNTVAVEFSHANAEIECPGSASLFDVSPQLTDCDFFSLLNLSLNDAPNSPAADTASPVICWHADVTLSPVQFHRLLGRNARVNSDRTTAVRLPNEYCNAFVFTSRPVHCGETVVIQVLSVDRSFISGLSFGLTACDPATVDPNSLPDDSDLLLDRLEYWVVNKDVCRNPEVGDELSFYMSGDGEVKYARNNQAPVTLMHVDRTLPLWAFFDVYGNVQKIKLIGTTMMPVQGRLSRPNSVGSCSTILAGGGVPSADFAGAAVRTSPLTVPQAGGDGLVPMPAHILQSNSIPESCSTSGPGHVKTAHGSHPASLPATPLSANSQNLLEEGTTDCKVCWERAINCVLYTCGHMCLCYECAMTIRSEKGLCPICRQVIVDVVRIYRS